jgi:16S rRNA G966 N2-methylase RsmD
MQNGLGVETEDILELNWEWFLQRVDGPFNVILMDPPYSLEKGWYSKVQPKNKGV